MKALEDLRELLIDQIKKVSKKGDISPNELECMYKSVDIIKDISTIEAMEKAEKEEEKMQRTDIQGVDIPVGVHMRGI